MTRQRTTAILCTGLFACLFAAPALRADEVVLKDGRILVGKTRKVGNRLEIKTVDGVVWVQQEEVNWERTRDEQTLQIALTRLAMRSGAGSCHAQLELARVAKNWGLYDEMWGYLGKVLRNGQQSAVMHRRTREFMGELEDVVLPKRWRKARPEIKVREILIRIRHPSPQAKVATVSELLTRVPDADALLRKRARSTTHRVQRGAIIRALAMRPEANNERFVYRTAILDGAANLRQDAMQITRELGRNEQAIAYIAPLLLHDNAKLRIRAAEAFGSLGDPAALPLLIAAGPTAGMLRKSLPGGATRAHMAVIQQISYVRDYDVEIAASSFIADPKVDVLHAGTVLDVTVISVKSHIVQVINAYRGAIRRLVNADPGPDPKTWDAWLKRQEAVASAVPTGPELISPKKR